LFCFRLGDDGTGRMSAAALAASSANNRNGLDDDGTGRMSPAALAAASAANRNLLSFLCFPSSRKRLSITSAKGSLPSSANLVLQIGGGSSV
jgi:hypothetical protein